MKVCDIVQFYSPLSGGVKRYIEDKIAYVAVRPELEHIVIVPSENNAVYSLGRTRIYEMKSARLIGSSSYRLLAAIRRIRAVIAQEKPDLIEVGDPYHTAWIAQRIAREFGIPIVAYYHSDYPRAFGRTLTRFCGRLVGGVAEELIAPYLCSLYNRMDATMVATPRLRETLAGIGVERVHCLPLGTNIRGFHPVDQRAALLAGLGLGEQTRLLLYVGRLAREKNVLQLIRMMDRIPAAERVVLLMVGDGEQRRLVEQMAAERNHIRWLPYCADPAILAAYYSAADVFVHPGTNETFGLVALEAQACGTPVVAVRNGGVDSTLMYEPEPAFAERAAPDELLAATLRVLARNETEVDRAARRQRMLTHFSREVSCLRIFGLYEKVCAVYPCNTVVAQPEFKWIEAHG